MKKSTKILCAILALVLTLGIGVGGTLAYIAAKTGEVVNTFTFGDLTVKLQETTGKNYQIIPGTNIDKDPKASVEMVDGADKIPAWLFVKVTEAKWPAATKTEGGRKVDYAIDPSWTKLEGVEGVNNVYYREITVDDYGTQFPILAGNQITVDGSLTKGEVDAAQLVGQPTLTFKAYAVQKDNLDVKSAWAQAETGTPGITDQK